MSAGQRYSWWTAFNVANEIVEAMEGAAARIAVAGSIRRGRADVGDIEIVYIPNANSETRLQRLVMDGMLSKPLQNRGAGRKSTPTWGAKIKFAQHVNTGVPVQFFAASAANWGYILWLRTGPGDANAAAVTKRGIVNHAGHYGILPHDVQMADGAIWRLPTPSKFSGTLPPGAVQLPAATEFDVFTALGIPYLLPPERSVQQYHALAFDGVRRLTELPEHLDKDWIWSPNGTMWRHVGNHEAYNPARLISEKRAMGIEAPVQAAAPPALHIDTGKRLGLTAADFNGKRSAIFGMTGQGKTNTTAVVIEELAGKMPITVIDKDGDYYRLKDDYPFEVVSATASRADVGLDIATARRVARRSVQERQSFVLDFSITKQQEMYDYLQAYVDELWMLTNDEAQRKPYMVVIEEAQHFFPQGRHTPLTQMFTDIATGGRKRGFSTILISQRPPLIDKNVLTQCEIMMLHKVEYPNDIARYAMMLQRKYEVVEAMLAKLRPGQCIVKYAGKMQVINVRARRSVHTGVTPELEPA